MLGVWIGAIQNMYPELGAGVEDHSILLREPLQRVARSVYPIMGVVYDGDRAAQTGAADQGLPRDDQGRRRRRPALSRAESRDVLLGARHLLHAGHQDRRVLLRRADRGREAPAVRRARAVVPQYGMSMRPVPKSWEEFCEYWDRVCSDELEINRATLDIFSIRIPKPWFVLMPTPIWDQMFKPMVGRPALDRRGAVRPGGAREGRHAVDAQATRCCCGCSASWSRWRSSWCPTRSGCTRARWPPTAAHRVALPTTRRWSRRRRSWRRRATAETCPCTTSRGARRLLDRAGSLVHTTFSLAGLRPARGRSTAA